MTDNTTDRSVAETFDPGYLQAADGIVGVPLKRFHDIVEGLVQTSRDFDIAIASALRDRDDIDAYERLATLASQVFDYANDLENASVEAADAVGERR